MAFRIRSLAFVFAICFPLLAWAQDKPITFLLASQKPLPIPDMTVAQLAAQYPAFKHKPFGTSGFNAMVMPFHYTDHTTKSTGDSAEATAFSFLLSNDLDWSPACYCARHAYFVYRRDHATFEALAQKYDGAAMASLFTRWGGTHAIGGTITKVDAGYTGTLEIYDNTSKQVNVTSFDKPESYFDLLGDMSVSAMKFLGPAPCDDLVKYLHQQRCTDPQSLVLLGQAPLAADRTAEFKLYGQILQNDPRFADVRYWLANQGGWMGMSLTEATLQRAEALDSYLTSECLRTFEFSSCPTKYKQKYVAWFEQGENFWGKTTPRSIAHESNVGALHKSIPQALGRLAIAGCGDFPNDYFPLETCAGIFGDQESECPDADMALSISLAAQQSGFEPGTGERGDTAYYAALKLRDLGRCDQAARILLTPGLEQREANIRFLLLALEEMGQYQASLDLLDRYATVIRPNLVDVLAQRAVAAAMCGRRDILDNILSEKHKVLADHHLLALVQAYRDSMDGKPVDADAVAKAYAVYHGWEKWMYLQFLAQFDLDRGQSLFLQDLKAVMVEAPGVRPGWILLDGYDRQQHQPDLADFYRTLRWLYPQDPWAASAVADWTQRNPKDAAAHADVALVRNVLTPFPAERWTHGGAQAAADQVKATTAKCTPWNAAAAIVELLNQHQYDAARDLSLRYVNHAAQTDHSELPDWANHLTYVVAERQDAVGN